MFLRMLTVGGLVAVGTLMSAPAAYADPICQSVVLTGTVYEPVGGCLPYGDDVSCDTTHTGAPSIEEIFVSICFPSLGAAPSS